MDAKEPKKLGCLKLTCSGCLILLLAAVLGGAMIWYALNRWDPGQSAWEHLPPSTTWAVEVHGLNQLLDNAMRDDGITVALAGAAEELIGATLTESGVTPHTQSDTVRDISALYERVRYFHNALVPNIAVIGEAGEGGDGLFALVRPTTLMRWGLGLPNEGADIVHVETAEIPGCYMAMIDGWLAVSLKEDTLVDILAEWKAARKPFGASPGRKDAYLAAGFRNRPQVADTAPNSGTGIGQSQPSPLMLHDPFASNETNNPSGKGEPVAMRLLLLPETNGWRLGGAVGWGDHGSGYIGDIAELGKDAPGSDSASVTLPSEYDMVLGATVAPDLLAEWQEHLSRIASANPPSSGDPWKGLAWLWLYNSWLANISGEIQLSTAKPAATAVDGVFPLPVFTLGWRWDPARDQARVKEDFTASLSTMLDSLTAPGGPAIEQAVRGSTSYQVKNTGTGVLGVVTIPPVMANSAKPAWFLPQAATPGIGWLATDPAGLPVTDPARQLQRGESGKPGIKESRGKAAWNVSDAFRIAFFDVARDRLASLPDGMFPGQEQLLENIASIEKAMRIFPKGSLWAACDTETNTAHFVLRVPHGEKARKP